jgi:hypothetical protein
MLIFVDTGPCDLSAHSLYNRKLSRNVCAINKPASPPTERAILFVHGFSSDLRKTWRQIPYLLMEEPSLAEWDFCSFGYQSRLDIRDPMFDKSMDRLAIRLTPENRFLIADLRPPGQNCYSRNRL